MKKLKLSMQYPLFITVILIFQAISPSTSAISDKRLCYDPDCSEAVSSGKTTVTYSAIEPNILSFGLNVDVKVFSKSAGSRDDLWGVEIGGKRGYVPQQFIREKTVLHKDLKYEVPTELYSQKPLKISDDSKKVKDETGSIIDVNVINNDNETVLPPAIDQISPSFEVIDGTTIYFSPKEEEQENRYATKSIQNPPTEKEQPILSIHPNLMSSEIPLDAASSVETGALSGSNKDSKISSGSQSINTKELTEKKLPTANNNELNVDNNITPSEKAPGEVLPETPSQTSSEKQADKEVDISIKENVKTAETEDFEEEEFEDDDEEEEDDDDDDDIVEEPEEVENNIEGGEQKELSEESAENKPDKTESETVSNTFANVIDTVTSLFEGLTTTASPSSEAVEENLEKVVLSDEREKVTDSTNVPSAVDEQTPKVTESPLSVVTEPETEKIQVDKQVLEEKETLSSEVIEETSKKTNVSTVAVPNKAPESEIASKASEKVSETEITSSQEPEKNSKEVVSFSDVTEKVRKVDAPPEIIEKTPEVNEKALKVETPVPIPKVKRVSLSIENEKITETTELPATVVPEKVQEAVEAPAVEIDEEASGTTETSVQLDLELDPPTGQNIVFESFYLINKKTQETVYSDNVQYEGVNKTTKIDEDKLNVTDTQDNIEKTEEEIMTQYGQPGINERDELSGSSRNMLAESISSFNEFPGSRNLLNVQSESSQDSSELIDNNKSEISTSDTTIAPEDKETHTIPSDTEVVTMSISAATEAPNVYGGEIEVNKDTARTEDINHVILPSEVCNAHNNCDESVEKTLSQVDEPTFDNEKEVIHAMEQGQNYWETLSYLTLTALTTLLFSLGYFYIENIRRDGQLIAKINKLEKELLISSKECTTLDETLNSTKTKLNSIEDESFGSNEMVSSLKADLDTANQTKAELENQVSILEKDLESATEAGLELERMLREILATKNEENPLAKSIEDLQTRLDVQQSANKSLTSALQLKTQENDSLKSELAANVQKCGQLEVEVTRLSEELKSMTTTKQEVEKNLTKKIEELEKQLMEITEQRRTLKTQLKSKEMEVKDLSDIVKKLNTNKNTNINLTKLSEVSQMKAEIDQLKEEKDDLKVKLTEVEGAHDLLEEHSKIINKEILSLTDQVKIAIKEKDEAETRLEVLTKFFQEKEAERQKEEAIWVQKQGEASTTVEKMQMLQNEIQNYKQQIETLKREVFDQEKEYKSQIAALEAKAHDQWVRARQSERRLEESKVESGQLRNRLTLIEKNLSDNESEAKTHRLESNGETATSPQLYIGAETSSSPLMFTGSSNIPPPYLYGPPLPPFLTSHLPTLPGYDVGQRPPPLGRLSSPPPIPMNVPGSLPPPPPLHTSTNSRYDHSGSSPSPPISPSILSHPHGPHGHFRSNPPAHPPPIPPFPNDRIPPVPLPGMLPPPHLSNTSWGEDKLSSRNNGSFHPFQRDQHPRDYKDLPEESVDRSRRSGKI